MSFISSLGDGGLIWIAIGFLFVLNKSTRKWGILMWVSMLMGLIFGNLILKNVVARIRPCDFYNVAIIIPHPGEFSFPSGHTLSSFAAALALYRHNKVYGLFALVFASIIGFTRMYLFVHYPTDILGGLVIGVMCGYISVHCLKMKVKS